MVKLPEKIRKKEIDYLMAAAKAHKIWNCKHVISHEAGGINYV